MEPININEFIVILKGLKHTLVKSQLYEQAALLRGFESDMYKLYGKPDNDTLDACSARLQEAARISNEMYVINFGEFILNNYRPYNFVAGGLGSPMQTLYRSNADFDPWDGEPSRSYTTEQVFEEYKKYCAEVIEKKKIEEALKKIEPPLI
jgi:hypothetical protein